MSLFHYEVVEANGKTVGAMKHDSPEKARALRDGLIGAGVNRPLYIARVVERTEVKRSVKRLKPNATY